MKWMSKPFLGRQRLRDRQFTEAYDFSEVVSSAEDSSIFTNVVAIWNSIFGKRESEVVTNDKRSARRW